MYGSFDPQPTYNRWLILGLGLLAAILVHTQIVATIDTLTAGRLFDPDAYMRLQRVLELQMHGQWFDGTTLRTNAPFGELIHWTRPFDMILLAGAWLGSTVTDFRTALEIWGRIVGPVLLLLLVVVWRFGTRGLLSDRGFIISMVLVPLLPLFDLTFAFNRPDHHGLLSLLFVASLVLMFRIVVTDNRNIRPALAVGILSGIAIWVSVEAVGATAYFAAALALLWLWRGQPYLGRIVYFMLGLFAALTLALVVERTPSDWTVEAYRSFSIVHWFAVGVGTITWIGLAAFLKKRGGGDTIRRRLAAVLVGALIPALAVAVVFPQFFQGPLVEYDAGIMSRWLPLIPEYQPIWPSTLARTALFIDELGPVLIAILFVLYRLRRGDQMERQLMLFLLLGFAFYLPLSLSVLRWTVYLQALAWLPWTLATLAVLDAAPQISLGKLKIPIRMPAVAVFVTAPALLALIVAAQPLARPQVASGAAGAFCDWPQMEAHLGQRHASANGNEQILLTDITRGPELVWNTPYSVIGAPYGNTQPLGDTFNFFGATEDRVPREIVKQRGVDLVLVCTGSPDRQFYHAIGPGSMFAQLTDGVSPDWLEPETLPEELAKAFRLYRVSL